MPDDRPLSKVETRRVMLSISNIYFIIFLLLLLITIIFLLLLFITITINSHPLVNH